MFHLSGYLQQLLNGSIQNGNSLLSDLQSNRELQQIYDIVDLNNIISEQGKSGALFMIKLFMDRKNSMISIKKWTSRFFKESVSLQLQLLDFCVHAYLKETANSDDLLMTLLDKINEHGHQSAVRN